MAETKFRDDQATGSSRYIGNLVMQVDSYDNDAFVPDSYPGTVAGLVQGGLLDRQRLVVAIRRTATNGRVPTIAHLQDETKLCRTSPGGYIALEGVRVDQGNLTAQWVNRMGGPDSELRTGLPIQISPSFGTDGNPRRFRSNGATVYNAQILHMKNLDSCEEEGPLRELVADALNDRGAAMIVIVSRGGADVADGDRRTLAAMRGWSDGRPRPVEDAVNSFMARNGGSEIAGILKKEDVADVIPMEVTRLGSRAAESIDLGGRHAVSIRNYMTGGLGARIETSLRQFGPDFAARIERAFLSSAHPNARTLFANQGWKGVWNSDVARFFGKMDVELPQVPKFGFAVSTAVLKPYPEGDRFLAKSRTLSTAVPRGAIPTPSDPEAYNRFHENIRHAVAAAIEAIPDGPVPDARPRNRNSNDFSSTRNEIGINRVPMPSEAGLDGLFDATDGSKEPDLGDLLDF